MQVTWRNAVSKRTVRTHHPKMQTRVSSKFKLDPSCPTWATPKTLSVDSPREEKRREEKRREEKRREEKRREEERREEKRREEKRREEKRQEEKRREEKRRALVLEIFRLGTVAWDL